MADVTDKIGEYDSNIKQWTSEFIADLDNIPMGKRSLEEQRYAKVVLMCNLLSDNIDTIAKSITMCRVLLYGVDGGLPVEESNMVATCQAVGYLGINNKEGLNLTKNYNDTQIKAFNKIKAFIKGCK